jgi:hypothetical protein
MRRDVAAYSVLISLAEISTLKLISRITYTRHSHTRHRAQFESYPQTATVISVLFNDTHTVFYFKCSI